MPQAQVVPGHDYPASSFDRLSALWQLELERLLPRFAAPKSEASGLELLTDPANMDGCDKSDPRSVARLGERERRAEREDVGYMDALLDPLDKHDEGIDHSDSF